MNNMAPNYTFRLRFNPEILRIIAYVGLIVMFLVGAYLTRYYVTVDPTTTTIYRLFGFNHSCNVLDHHPSKTVSAMLLPFWQIPFVLYVIFNFLRIQDAYRENKVARYVYRMAAVFLPIELLLTVWFGMVFVWHPDDSFLAHYLPYVGFQILLFMTAFENVLYFYAVDSLPFGNNRTLAIGYLVVLFVTTFMYILFGMAIALGNPILDSANNLNHRLFLQYLTYFYFVLAVPLPLILSILELRRSPDHELSFA